MDNIGTNTELEQGKPKPFLVKTKIEDLMAYTKQAIANFPRNERQTAAEIRRIMLLTYELAITIEKRYYKKTTAQELDVNIDILRHLVRTARENKYYSQNSHPPLSPKQYEIISKMLNEIGKMVGGYMKSLNK